MDKTNLTNVSIINIICVFVYTEKNAINTTLKRKYIRNLSLKHLLIEFDFSSNFLLSVSCFNVKIFASLNESCFNKTLIIAEIIVENNI